MADYGGTHLIAFDSSVLETEYSFEPGRPAWEQGVSLLSDELLNGTQSDTPFVPEDFTGTQLFNFDVEWLHKVHVINSPLNINASSGDTTKYFYLYNTVFDRQEVLTLGIDGVDDGVILDLNVGDVLTSLQYRGVAVTVSANEGPPTFEVDYTFTWGESPDSIASVSGTRIVLWVFEHNWVDSFTESSQWATDVIVAKNATEQRRSLSTVPRTTYTFSFLEKGLPATDLRNTLYSNLAGRFLVPIPHSVQSIASPVAGGALTVPYATEDTPVRDGGYLMYTLPSGGSGLLQVADTSDPAQVTLTTAVPEDLPTGTTMRPGVIVTAETPVTVSTLTDQMVKGTITFMADNEATETTTYLRDSGLTLLGDKPVFDFRHNWANPKSDQFIRTSREINYSGRGLRELRDYSEATSISQGTRVTLKGTSEIARFKKFIQWCKGRARSFWVRSEFHEVVLAQPVANGAGIVTLSDNGVIGPLSDRSGNRLALYFHLVTGQYLYLEITGAYSEGVAENTYDLVLRDAAGFDLDPAQINRSGFCYRSRLQADTVLFEYKTDDLMDCELALVAVEE